MPTYSNAGVIAQGQGYYKWGNALSCDICPPVVGQEAHQNGPDWGPYFLQDVMFTTSQFRDLLDMKEYLLGSTAHYNKLSLKQREQLTGYIKDKTADEAATLDNNSEGDKEPGAEEQVAGI